MLMPHPALLRRLVDEYTALCAQPARDVSGTTTRRLQGLMYTLCVSTGTREIADALEAARRQLGTATATAKAAATAVTVVPAVPAVSGVPVVSGVPAVTAVPGGQLAASP